MCALLKNERAAAGSPGSEEVDRYRALLASDPNSRAFAQLADAYRLQGRYAEAIAVCARGLQRYPAYVNARLVLARALAQQGETGRASEEYRRILEITPDNVAAHRELGDLLRAGGQLAAATAVYRNLLDLAPFDGEVQALLAGLQARRPPAPRVPQVSLRLPPVASGAAVSTFDLSEAAQAPPLPLMPVDERPEARRVPEELPAPAAEGPHMPPAPPPAAPPVMTYDLSETTPAEVPAAAASPSGGPQAAATPPDVLATETLADLYVQQGFTGEASSIYRELLRRDPSRGDIRAKLAALSGEAGKGAVPVEVTLEPAGVAPASSAAGAGQLERTLEAWLAAARGLRRERGRR